MTIVNPFAEKAKRDARDASIMDIKNLARNLYIQNSADGTYTATRAFEEAIAFVNEQTKRFPDNDTVDGRSKE